MTATGSLTVPNVGVGDIEITFNQHDVSELAKAIGMLKDMQRRGYAILVRLEDGTYARAHEIDEKRGKYVVMVPSESEPEERCRCKPVARKWNPDTLLCDTCGRVPAQKWLYAQELTPAAEPAAPELPAADVVEPEESPPVKRGRGRPRKVQVSISKSHATGVARSAGG